jgi:hypothetical protein
MGSEERNMDDEKYVGWKFESRLDTPPIPGERGREEDEAGEQADSSHDVREKA